MAAVVWREPLRGRLNEVIQIALPKNAMILRAGIAPDGAPSIWFLCNAKAPKDPPRLFKVVETGTEVADNARWVGMWWEGHFVFHLFELFTEEDDSAILDDIARNSSPGVDT